MRILLFLVAMTISANASAGSICTELYYASVIADAYTTKKVLDDGGVERNPLFGSRPSDSTIAVSVAVRILSGYFINRYSHENINCFLAALTFGVVGNNVGVLDGRGGGDVNSILLGVTLPLTIEAIYREVTR